MNITLFRQKISIGGNFLLDLVFPITCQGCKTEGVYLCLSCQTQISILIQRCILCGKNSLLSQIHANCQNHPPLSGILTVADYQDPRINQLIGNLKYNGIKAMAENLALVACDFLISQDLLDYFSEFTIVSVPLHKRKHLDRGFNQAELIASSIARRLNLPMISPLARIKKTKTQVGQDREHRIENLKGAFALADEVNLENKKILLIDDVATTGATLLEAARTLQKAKPAQIWGLVIARN